MLSCKDTSLLVSQALDRRLSWRERVAVRIHLFACEACSRFARQMDFLRRAARRGAGNLLQLRPAARERMRRTLHGSGR